MICRLWHGWMTADDAHEPCLREEVYPRREHEQGFVLCTAEGGPMEEKTLRAALDRAKTKVGLDGTEERLSWHSLRHSYASMLATDLELQATTLTRLAGHADAGFTLKVYARDGRDDAAVVKDVLMRAAAAKVGG